MTGERGSNFSPSSRAFVSCVCVCVCLQVALSVAPRGTNYRVMHEGLHLRFYSVIHSKCDGGTAGRADHFGCLFDRFRPIVR
jgi:hypothetical protein